MDKIIFKIGKNLLTIDKYTKDIKTDLNNTNVIDTKEIVFSTDYINNNLELVSSFLNVIIIKQNIKKTIIKDYDIILSTLSVLNHIPNIKDIYIKPDKRINYDTFMKLLDNRYIENLNVFDIAPALLERLDKNNNLKITVRSEILFTSNFLNSNNINTYSDIFYKKNIIIDNFTNEDKEDFESFIKINKYLKTIEFKTFNKETFVYILDTLTENKKNNIKVIVDEKGNINEIYDIITKYKNKYEKILDDFNISFKINYSKDYKEKNFLKQFNLNIIKLTLLCIILVVAGMLGYNIYQNYRDNHNQENIEADLNKILKDSVVNNLPTTTTKSNEITNGTTKETTTTIYDIKYDKVFEKLLEINPDTVGWLTLNNTNIDYPVVKQKDNNYYLKRDYYQNKNRHGWIFMDYRNNIDELDKNTIIYGHNLANQKMFGTLRYALNSYWYKKTKNQIITFNTTKENMRWQIFSIYTTPVVTDYLETEFKSDGDYLSFLTMLSKRSIYDFNQTFSADDKILTLSTCSNGTKNRLVVHAKLIKED